jgi:hypothetical protein
MASIETERSVLLVRAEDGTCFAIPREVVERGRVTGERADELRRLVESGDVSGFSGGVLLPAAADDAAYALPVETLLRYALPPEQAAPADDQGEDVAGHWSLPTIRGLGAGPCPPGYTPVVVPGYKGVASLRCVEATPPVAAWSAGALQYAVWR